MRVFAFRYKILSVFALGTYLHTVYISYNLKHF